MAVRSRSAGLVALVLVTVLGVSAAAEAARVRPATRATRGAKGKQRGRPLPARVQRAPAPTSPATSRAAATPSRPRSTPPAPRRLLLDDFEGAVAQRWQNLTPSTDPVRSGRTSGRWSGALTDAVNLKLPHDWTPYQKWTLSVWCHSAKPTGAAFILMLASDRTETVGPDFYYHLVTVDWSGWRELRVPLSAFKPWENPVGFRQVDAVAFNTSINWVGTRVVPGTILHFDDLSLEE